MFHHPVLFSADRPIFGSFCRTCPSAYGPSLIRSNSKYVPYYLTPEMQCIIRDILQQLCGSHALRYRIWDAAMDGSRPSLFIAMAAKVDLDQRLNSSTLTVRFVRSRFRVRLSYPMSAIGLFSNSKQARWCGRSSAEGLASVRVPL